MKYESTDIFDAQTRSSYIFSFGVIVVMTSLNRKRGVTTLRKSAKLSKTNDYTNNNNANIAPSYHPSAIMLKN
jgi:hypothetical protein